MGKATVRLSPPWWNHWRSDGSQEPEPSIEKTVKLDNSGKATVTFTFKEINSTKIGEASFPYDEKSLQSEYNSFNIHASVNEDLTEIQRNASTSVNRYKNEVKLVVEKQGENFKPGLSYPVFIALKRMDDTSVKSSIPRRVMASRHQRKELLSDDDILQLPLGGPPSVHFQCPHSQDLLAGFHLVQSNLQVKFVDLDAHGLASITLHPPRNVSGVAVEVRYDRSGKDNYTYTDQEAYRLASVLEESLQHSGCGGQQESLPLLSPTHSSLEELDQDRRQGLLQDQGHRQARPLDLPGSFHYRSCNRQVMSRGTVVLVKTLSSDKDLTTISFKTTPEMAPKSRLIVYAIRSDNNEILVDASDFQVSGIFRNNVGSPL